MPTSFRFVATLALLLAMTAGLHSSTPIEASVCRSLPFTFSDEAMREVAEDGDFIFVGQVVSSWTLPHAPSASGAVIYADAFLKGHVPSSHITLLGLGNDCSAGPSMSEGERVLLVVDRVGPSNEYYVSEHIGKTVFRESGAYTDPISGDSVRLGNAETAVRRWALGNAETAVRRWAEAAGAPAEATDEAILAVREGTARSSKPSDLVILGGVVACVFLVLLVITLERRKAS